MKSRLVSVLGKMIQRGAVLLACVVVLSSLSGCLKTLHILIKPKPDGSGILDYTLTLKQETVDMIKEFHRETPSSNTEPNGEEAPGDGTTEMRKIADSSNGVLSFIGVDFVIKNGDTLGATGHYAFRDIRALKVKDLFKTRSSMNLTGDDTTSQIWSQFEFERGNPAVLRVRSLHPESALNFDGALTPDTAAKKKGAKKEDHSLQDAMLVIVADMFDSLEMKMEIEPQGNIISTDAQHREGNRLVFANVNLGGFKALAEARKKGSKKADKILADMKKNMWIETQPMVTIRFKE